MVLHTESQDVGIDRLLRWHYWNVGRAKEAVNKTEVWGLPDT